jgi:hypothetical protein
MTRVPLLRIVARRVRWPDFQSQPNRESLSLRWDALTEDGRHIAGPTEHPFTDAAHALLTRDGLPGDTPVTMCHLGAAHDSFLPMPLVIAAAAGLRRARERDRMAARRLWLPKHRAVAVPDDRLHAPDRTALILRDAE